VQTLSLFRSRSSNRLLPSDQLARCVAALLLSGLTMGQTVVQAQAVYRSVGPDGKVTFSDIPPQSVAGKATPTVNLLVPGQAEQTNLPLEVRQASANFPVTLFTSSACAPCDSGRNLLINRGVPFAEKTVATAEDAEALQKLSGTGSLPFLTIGGQHVSGFLASEWTQYLNAAGYPEQSKLPANYRRPPAAPLVALQKVQPNDAGKPATPAAAPVNTAPPVGPNPNNPAGIQF
jgi:glutaredoxin